MAGLSALDFVVMCLNSGVWSILCSLCAQLNRERMMAAVKVPWFGVNNASAVISHKMLDISTLFKSES